MKLDKAFLERAKKLHNQDRLYGTTTMGARGQVVIPAKARADFKLKAGDQLLVLGKFGKVLAFMKADQMEEFVNMIMDHVAGTSAESLAKTHITKLFGSLKKSKKNS
ncbi:MAG: AbrB/MazE/SpoVT family DNA-binding domain-containing protein [bacterium]|nr:AbrB/MazE/SpoVT family DNA-binding domain-containing protein [bacterium]